MITLTCAITNRPKHFVLGEVYAVESHPSGSLIRTYCRENGLAVSREVKETPDRVREIAKWIA